MRPLVLVSLFALVAVSALPLRAAGQAANPEGEPKQPLSNRPSAELVPVPGAHSAQPALAFIVTKGSLATIRIVSQDVRSQPLSAQLADAPCNAPPRASIRLAPIVRGSSDTTLRGADARRLEHGTPTIRVGDEHGKPLLCGALKPLPAGSVR